MYHVVFDVVQNQLTKCVKFKKTEIKDFRFDLRFVSRKFEI